MLGELRTFTGKDDPRLTGAVKELEQVPFRNLKKSVLTLIAKVNRSGLSFVDKEQGITQEGGMCQFLEETVSNGYAARVYHVMGDEQRRNECTLREQEENPKALADYNKAIIYNEQNNLIMAKNHFEFARAKLEKNTRLWLQATHALCVMLIKSGEKEDLAEAKFFYKIAVREGIRGIDIWGGCVYNLGMLFKKDGEVEKARKYWQMGLDEMGEKSQGGLKCKEALRNLE